MDQTTRTQLETLAQESEGIVHLANQPNSPLPDWAASYHAGRAQAIREIMDLLCVPSEA